MKVLLTGGRGMLGRTICDELAEFEIVATDLPEADITDEGGIDAVLERHRPDAVIHCAAMTARARHGQRGVGLRPAGRQADCHLD